ncbi:MAG: metallophosphoesterase [Chloroflexi bacterium AL-N1]|nr:metallophosphoesterase [Chloroflexi bacterium AL-N1]NOK77310.1 metallophosphoesterase [Chloroflexi bacterium AL-N5]
MRVLIISDIHSNYVALETVLSCAGSFDQLWNLGDTIGYGPCPNECMASMRQLATVMIAGNHDLACLGKVDLNDFNPDARSANLWNGEQLAADHRMVLESLPPKKEVDERFMMAHGSPREPVWEYMLSGEQARINFALFAHQICFIGHSHVPLVFFEHRQKFHDEALILKAGQTIELDEKQRYFINPGSVGQPRDQDPRASYALLDTDANTIRLNRVEYDIAKTQRQMREARLPSALIRRLEYGM